MSKMKWVEVTRDRVDANYVGYLGQKRLCPTLNDELAPVSAGDTYYNKITGKYYQLQEVQDMQSQDNSWFERKELPPVGTECAIETKRDIKLSWGGKINQGDKVEIIAHFRVNKDSSEQNAVCAFIHFDADHSYNVYQGIREVFRPLKSEREKAIDEMVGICVDHYGNPKGAESYINLCTKIYDAGLLKEPSQ